MMRIEGLEQTPAVPSGNGNQNAGAIRRQIKMLEQERSRLTEKKGLTESEQKRVKQIEQEIERLKQQLMKMEEKNRRDNRTLRRDRAEPGKGESVDEWR